MESALDLALSNIYKYHSSETFVNIKKYAMESIQEYAQLINDNLSSQMIGFTKDEKIQIVCPHSKHQVKIQDFQVWHDNVVKLVQDIIEPKSESNSVQSSSSGSKQKWSQQEEQVLEDLIEKFQDKKIVQKEFQSKTGTKKSISSIYQHWNRVQNPTIQKGRFKTQEDLIVIQGYNNNLSTSQIAAQLSCRTPKQVLNRFYTLNLKENPNYNIINDQ
ncbi:hypothetical protein SS50377_26589 [Spironucleus salmonicida]|uniref:Myb-like domain-containing protein n=1 Tax=Spironucleus salmonicida TaxID=348837 RepID=V6LAK4_9EUKA|nr:hypothetical protein SS50377_26589 [Spironucleus salmonicida]|eukprot:EST41442.1 Hypothetical protein SS50377_19159 [Spironucleus salmonicida]